MHREPPAVLHHEPDEATDRGVDAQAARIPITAPEMPEVDMHFIETMDPEGPAGAKGVGEAPSICIAAAIVNALYNATGKRFTSLPLTPERVLRGLKEGA